MQTFRMTFCPPRATCCIRCTRNGVQYVKIIGNCACKYYRSVDPGSIQRVHRQVVLHEECAAVGKARPKYRAACKVKELTADRFFSLYEKSKKMIIVLDVLRQVSCVPSVERLIVTYLRSPKWHTAITHQLVAAAIEHNHKQGCVTRFPVAVALCPSSMYESLVTPLLLLLHNVLVLILLVLIVSYCCIIFIISIIIYFVYRIRCLGVTSVTQTNYPKVCLVRVCIHPGDCLWLSMALWLFKTVQN